MKREEVRIVGYNPVKGTQVHDKAQRKICETNLNVLTTAVEYYGLEYDALPATLGDLRRDHFERAYANVMEENPWSSRFYGTVAKFGHSGESHAAFLTYDNLKAMTTAENFKDPADSNGGVSYGINASLVGKKWSEIGSNAVIVADSDSYVFNGLRDLIKRHSRGLSGEHLAMGITKGKEILVFSEVLSSMNIANNLPIDLNSITTFFDGLVNSTLAPVADKAEDVRNKLWVALSELSKSPPDTAAARGNIEGAQADLQVMITDGLIDKVVGIDIIFSGKSEEGEDRKLVEAIASHPGVILGYILNPGSSEKPLNEFVAAAASTGLVNKPYKMGVLDRTRTHYANSNGEVELSLDIEILRNYLGVDRGAVKVTTKGIALGNKLFIPSQKGIAPLNYLVHPVRFRIIPVYFVLKNKVDSSYFKDKIYSFA